LTYQGAQMGMSAYRLKGTDWTRFMRIRATVDEAERKLSEDEVARRYFTEILRSFHVLQQELDAYKHEVYGDE